MKENAKKWFRYLLVIVITFLVISVGLIGLSIIRLQTVDKMSVIYWLGMIAFYVIILKPAISYWFDKYFRVFKDN